MQGDIFPLFEQERLAALHALDVLDTCPEAEFDALVAAAARICNAPMALVTLVDAQRQWFKASIGLPAGLTETPRIVSFCSHAVLASGLFIVADASRDPRFADNPLVAGEPDIRFYAGAPLRLQGGHQVGTLCVLDRKPRELSGGQREALLQLAQSATRALETRAQQNAPRPAGVTLPTAQAEDGVGHDFPGTEHLERVLAGALVHDSEDAIIAKTPDGIVLYWNRGAERIFGHAADEMIGRPITTLFPPDRLHEEGRLMARIRAGEKISHFETQRLRKDGTLVDISVSLSPIRDRRGQLFAISKIARDISARVQAERALVEQREWLSTTLRSIADVVVTCRNDGLIDWINPAAERITGWPVAQAQGQPVATVFRFIEQDTRAPVAPTAVAELILHGWQRAVAAARLLVARDGSEYGVEVSSAPILAADGALLGSVLVMHDATEQRRLSGEMAHKASHDGLTSLFNRAEFETRLRHTLASAHADGCQHALLYIDLDQFKLVNDACGHTIGDVLLRQVARLLATTVRSHDTLARLGGDEFGALLQGCTLEQARGVAQKICDRMEEFRFVHEGRRFRIGASIGLVPVDARWDSINTILQAADSACYAAKDGGRNRVHTWLESDQALLARNGEMRWAARIERALDEDRVVLQIQRIVPVLPGRQGFRGEVLVRIREDNAPLVLASAFVSAAERFQLAARLDRRVLGLLVAWLGTQTDLSGVDLLCVNLSGQSIVDRVFHHHALELLGKLDPAVRACLCLEITETAAVTNLGDAAIFVEQMHALGVRVALDDFGAGASSFSYLKSLEVDYLKIDGRFIQGLTSAPLDRVAVKCFVDVARVIGVPTVAEFVDRAELLDELIAAGIDYAQGFLLHAPENLPKRIETLQSFGTPACAAWLQQHSQRRASQA